MTQHFARIADDGVVAEIVTLPDGIDLSSAFTPELVQTMVACSADVTQGQIYQAGAFAAPPPPPGPTRAELLAYAADKRWRIETGGITVDGAQVDTSRDSQAMIANAHAYIVASGAPSITYKAVSGWVAMDAAAVTAVALAVGAHVQASFAFERNVDAQIDDGTIATTAAIDALAWPA